MRTPITWAATIVLVISVGLSIALLPASRSSAQAQVCSNGIVEPPETFDPPSTPCFAGSPASAFRSASNCQCTCANGVVDPGEQCDPTSPSGAFCVGGPCNLDCTCPTVTTTTSPTTTTTLPDHQQCYEVKPATFQSRTVTLQDEFGILTLAVRFPHRLCAPADKNGEGIHDATDHLTGYVAKAPFSKVQGLTVTDQFGSLQLDVVRPDLLMVPTSKDGVQQQPALDHFMCYKVRRAHGAAKFVSRSVSVGDQFETVSETLLKPIRLCSPANKEGEDQSAPDHPGHLLCYKTKTFPFADSEHSIANQFGTDQVTLIHRRELCVPSIVAGSGDLLDAGYFKDLVDGGDKPLDPGCHCSYSDPVCSMDERFFAGDKCYPSGVSLGEWVDTTCHQHFQRPGRDIVLWNCNKACGVMTGAVCVTDPNFCNDICDHDPGDSAHCKCP